MHAKDMEIGEVREHEGKKYKAIEFDYKASCACDCEFSEDASKCAASVVAFGKCGGGRKDKKSIGFKLISCLIIVLMLASCTTPRYSRTVSRTYTANGELVETVITEKISQHDPYHRPLNKKLKRQTYEGAN